MTTPTPQAEPLPADTFSTIALISEDATFAKRERAGASKEGVPNGVQWVQDNAYDIAAAPGWAAAVDYALLVDPTVDWQNDQSVINDANITAQIQYLGTPPDPNHPEPVDDKRIPALAWIEWDWKYVDGRLVGVRKT
jgi:hypothetical protein